MLFPNPAAQAPYMDMGDGVACGRLLQLLGLPLEEMGPENTDLMLLIGSMHSMDPDSEPRPLVRLHQKDSMDSMHCALVAPMPLSEIPRRISEVQWADAGGA